MVRLKDLPDYEREHLLSKSEPPLGPPAWTPLAQEISSSRIALITTAGLHFRDDPAFQFADATFRPISGDENADNLVIQQAQTDTRTESLLYHS